MGRVCVILPLASAGEVTTEGIARVTNALSGAGDHVEVLAVLPADVGETTMLDPSVSWLRPGAENSGLSTSMVAGLSRAVADYLIVLDPTRGYDPAELPRLIEPLKAGLAEIVVARRAESSTGLLGRIARPILGVTEPFSGLVALTADVARDVTGTFDPVGDRFVVDLLFRSRGRRTDVSTRTEAPDRPLALSLDDLRHIKRLADDRFGNLSRLVQFCVVGASGMVVDLSSYALFQLLFSRTGLAQLRAPLVGGTLDLAAAGALAILLALTWNFSLNRRLTFNYARDGSIVRQFLTYALSNALGVLLSFTLRLTLPAKIGFFNRHRLAAAVVGIVTATGISFSMARWFVFGRRVEPNWEPLEATAVGTAAES